jgi:hypothetical protein
MLLNGPYNFPHSEVAAARLQPDAPGPALAIYARQGAIHWSGEQDEAREALVRQWGRDLGPCGRSGRGPLCLRLHQPRRPRTQCRLARRPQGARGARRGSPDHQLTTADGVAPFAKGSPCGEHRRPGYLVDLTCGGAFPPALSSAMICAGTRCRTR